MRRDFHSLLLRYMEQDPRIVLITGDLGFGMFDRVAERFPARFHNVGAAEQLMLGVAVGLALDGYIPVTYTITPFYWRCAEFIRNYADHEQIAVKLVGGGRNRDYAHDGFTHDASDDRLLFSCFPRVAAYWPGNLSELNAQTYLWLYAKGPAYLNLSR